MGEVIAAVGAIADRIAEVWGSARTRTPDQDVAHELACGLYEIHTDVLAELEELAAGIRFATVEQAEDLLARGSVSRLEELVAAEAVLLRAARRWVELRRYAEPLVGEVALRLAELDHDAVRAQAERATEVLQEIAGWRPQPYWSLKNVAGYPQTYRHWSAAGREAQLIRERATRVLVEVQPGRTPARDYVAVSRPQARWLGEATSVLVAAAAG